MKIKTITMIFSIVTLIIVLAYDGYAVFVGGTEASISSLIINFSYKMPMFTFLCGFTCGHLFWKMRSNEDTVKNGIDKETKAIEKE